MMSDEQYKFFISTIEQFRKEVEEVRKLNVIGVEVVNIDDTHYKFKFLFDDDTYAFTNPVEINNVESIIVEDNGDKIRFKVTFMNGDIIYTNYFDKFKMPRIGITDIGDNYISVGQVLDINILIRAANTVGKVLIGSYYYDISFGVSGIHGFNLSNVCLNANGTSIDMFAAVVHPNTGEVLVTCTKTIS